MSDAKKKPQTGKSTPARVFSHYVLKNAKGEYCTPANASMKWSHSRMWRPERKEARRFTLEEVTLLSPYLVAGEFYVPVTRRAKKAAEGNMSPKEDSGQTQAYEMYGLSVCADRGRQRLRVLFPNSARSADFATREFKSLLGVLTKALNFASGLPNE